MCRRLLSLGSIRPAPALPPLPAPLALAPPGLPPLRTAGAHVAVVPMNETDVADDNSLPLANEGMKTGEGEGEGEAEGEGEGGTIESAVGEEQSALEDDAHSLTGLMTSKLNRLVVELRRVLALDSTAKCLVFSQFTQVV